MTNSTTPACVISGTSSGSGKTTVTLGIMAALKNRGLHVQPFKCGPDFIDPGLHRLVTGRISRNLDLWMAGEPFCSKSFIKNSEHADIAIVEGVMGMFDGGISSSGYLSEQLNIANILVLDVRSMAESGAAIVKGFQTLNPNANLKGVILNRIASDRHLELVSGAIAKHCDVEILGYLPRTIEFTIPSRHLGLLTGEEAPISQNGIELLAKTVKDYIDLDKLINLCKPPQLIKEKTAKSTSQSQCRIAVARDKAFCFYYEDNFDILRDGGAELVFFSPIEDQRLPENIDGIYLGGGYPELYAKDLSSNKPMLESLLKWIENDGPVYAECGGFMYLTEGIEDPDGQFQTLVGAFPTRARMQKKRVSLGYREITTEQKSCFGDAGTTMRGHEFHYSDIDKMPEHIPRIYKVNKTSSEGYSYRKVLGGYMHLHFGYNPEAATAFIKYCQEK